MPTPQNIRDEIEAVPQPETRMYLKCLTTFCSRSAEFAHVPCNGEKAYGTVGKEFAWKAEYQPQTIDGSQLAMAMANSKDFAGLRDQLKGLMQPFKIAVFKIPIAKKHLLVGEPIVYRHTAMPWDKKYEPWTQEIYNYYQQKGSEPLFPENRKHYLDYLRVHGIFKNFSYPVERYTIHQNQGLLSVVPESDNPLVNYRKNKKTDEISQYTTIPKHYHRFKLHGLRHIRTGEYISFYKITSPLALCALIGWASRSGPEAMIGRYGNIYEAYDSYVHLLFKTR